MRYFWLAPCLILLSADLFGQVFGAKNRWYSYQQDTLQYGRFTVHEGKRPDVSAEERAKLDRDLREAQRVVGDFLHDVHNLGSKDGKRMREIFNMDRAEGDVPGFEKCLADLETVESDYVAGELYAIYMTDSWGKDGGRWLEGNVRWPGGFYECRKSGQAVPANRTFSTQYYTAYYGFKFEPTASTYPIDIAFGTCWPSTCDNVSASVLMPTLTAPGIPLIRVQASDVNNTFDTVAIIAISVSSLLLLWNLIGSCYHCYCYLQVIEESKRSKILMSSSVVANIEKICSTKKSPGTIPTLDGIRVITTLWVILGHSYLFVGNNIDNSVTEGQSLMGGFLYMTVLNGTFSVDTFFCIGGLLTCYLTLKQLRSTKGYSFIPLMYIKRYLRLTPVYAYVILFSLGLYKFFGDGPYWKRVVDKTTSACQEYWWSNLLYISTLYPISNPCIGWAWYLTDDMIFYYIAPFIVIVMTKSLYIGLGLAFSIVCANIGIVAWMSVSSELAPAATWAVQQFNFWYRILIDSDSGVEPQWSGKFQGDIYYLPWCRIGAYMIGMMAGCLLFYSKRKVKMNKLIVLLGWLTSTVFALLMVFGLWDYTKDQAFMDAPLATFYNCMTRPVWAACIAWVVVACTSGYGGPATIILDLGIFKPIGRLTYSAYLIHPFVIYWHSGTTDQPFHYSKLEWTYQYIGNIVLVFLMSFFVALLIEWPFQELTRLAFPSSQRKSLVPPVEVRHDDVASSSSSSTTDGKISNPPSYTEMDYKNEAYVDEKQPPKENTYSTIL